jgi:glyceraldehyde-3-phosphate dehydrogenase/erythrose-4-phosphate dehydrogenase
MSTRIAINGLGRSGRCLVRALAQRDTGLELVAVNDVADAAGLAALLRYDFVYGRFPAPVSLEDGSLVSGPLAGILGYTEDPIVSTDVIGDDRSSLVDGSLTTVSGTTAKIISWYDSEWAYACRLVELAGRVAAALRAEAAISA